MRTWVVFHPRQTPTQKQTLQCKGRFWSWDPAHRWVPRSLYSWRSLGRLKKFSTGIHGAGNSLMHWLCDMLTSNHGAELHGRLNNFVLLIIILKMMVGVEEKKTKARTHFISSLLTLTIKHFFGIAYPVKELFSLSTNLYGICNEVTWPKSQWRRQIPHACFLVWMLTVQSLRP